MKKLLFILIPCMLTTGCAAGLYTAAAMSRGRHAARVHHTRLAEPPPVGRWDNVMMLEPGTPLKVLTMDGTVIVGRFVTANTVTLRIDSEQTTSVAAASVMRVDRIGTASGTVASEGARGAVVGAGAAGVLGLLLGVTPPPRVFAGAAVLGAYQGATSAAGIPGPGTVYLAKQ